MTRKNPVVLCILDGWGLAPEGPGNAVALARTPNYDRVMATCPRATLTTFGPDVGLPTGQMGNSEVGHTNIGAGRVVTMDLVAIDMAIDDGSFRTRPALTDFIAALRASGGTAHVLGLVSDGGVHSQFAHMEEAIRTLSDAGIPVAVHAIADGRDVAPRSVAAFVDHLQQTMPVTARIKTVLGRYFAMDRDNRWERVQRAYDAMVRGQGLHLDSRDARDAVYRAYERGESDEFIQPTVMGDYQGMKDGDGLFMLNYRADRAREILSALADPDFAAFATPGRPAFAAVLGMVDYSERHNTFMQAVFPKQVLVNTLGDWVAAQGLRQFRLAETEKYPHVTFFLNGGREAPFAGEDRAMPPSPKVATYDLAPEMSAAEVGDRLVAAIGAGYDLIVVNFANPDMVGHTGIVDAAVRACEAVDHALGRALAALERAGGAMLLTADHGNCEMMIDPVTGGPHTAHTLNPVPVALVGWEGGVSLADGRLADVAPTVLHMMGLPQPPEMTGNSLIRPG